MYTFLDFEAFTKSVSSFLSLILSKYNNYYKLQSTLNSGL